MQNTMMTIPKLWLLLMSIFDYDKEYDKLFQIRGWILGGSHSENSKVIVMT